MLLEDSVARSKSEPDKPITMTYRNILVISLVSMIMPYAVQAGAIMSDPCAEGGPYTVIQHDLHCLQLSSCNSTPEFINTCDEVVTLADVTCSDHGLDIAAQAAGFKMTDDGLGLSNVMYSSVYMSLDPKNHGSIFTSASNIDWSISASVFCNLNAPFFDEKTKVMTLHFKKGDTIYTSRFFIPSAPDEVDNWWKWHWRIFLSKLPGMIFFASPGLIALLLAWYFIRIQIRRSEKK